MAREYTLSCAMWIPLPMNKVFSFFADAHNLAAITPPWLSFVIHTPHPIDMRAGCYIDYTIRLIGVPLNWRTLISDYDPPHKFEDQQLKGPYRRWVHRHEFVEENGGITVRDAVCYVIPGGPLAPLAQALFVRRQLTDIFNFRQNAIAKLLLGEQSALARILQPVQIN